MFTDKSAARVRKFPSVHCRESLSPARPPTQHNPAPSWIKILIVDHQSRMPRSVWISVTFFHLAKTLIYNQLMDHFLPTDTFENAQAGLLTPHLLFKLAFCTTWYICPLSTPPWTRSIGPGCTGRERCFEVF